MKSRHILYCDKMTSEELKKLTSQLRSGVDVECCREENGMILLSVVGRKKKGRPPKKEIDLNQVLKFRASGCSMKDISEKTGCSVSYLYKLLQREKEK